jgi:hypothetical protein
MYSTHSSKLKEAHSSLSWIAARSSMAITRFRLRECIDEADMEAAREMLDTLNALEKVAEIRAENLLTKGNFPDGCTLGLRTLSALTTTEGGRTLNVTQLVDSVLPVLKALCSAGDYKPLPTPAQLDKAALAVGNFSEELGGSHFVLDHALEDSEL